MSYQQALEKAWDAVSNFPNKGGSIAVKLLSDNYTINMQDRAILSDSCNVPAKEHIAILLLHYLARRSKPGGIPPATGQWLDFKELPGGEGYYPAFKKRTVDRVLKKYAPDPDSLKNVLSRMPGEISDKADVGVIIHPFE